MIEIRQLCKQFKKLKALDEISVDFQSQEVTSLIGPNGSGKTTLIKCILGLVRPDSGHISIQGESIGDHYNYRAQIGYMPQIGRYPDHMKVGQLFDLLIELRNLPKDQQDVELIEAFQLRSIYHKSMRTLSGGTRQKVSAAVAFLFDPPIYILDEPTAGLDPLASEILKEKIHTAKNKNKLILITSHVLSDFDELTTHVLYLQDGKVRYNSSMDELKEFTGEQKFGKAIASIMMQNQ
ncbi:MAG: ABC transporter ATP-binding protein [Saprospiraceae bacterium]|nr:ABC transporter ATP-binding protein [Saprospiraceae bacterium]